MKTENYPETVYNKPMHYYLIGRILILAVLSQPFFLSCYGTSQDNKEELKKDLFTINVETVIEKNEYIPLSDVGMEIIYIPLESGSDFLLKQINSIEITESFIFVSDKDRLLQFTKHGEFVKQIGNKGRGPGEYSDIMHFSVNEQGNIILILGGYQFNKYDIKGNFTGPVTNAHGGYFKCCQPNRIVFYKASSIENPTNLILTDQNLNVLSTFQNPHPGIKTNLSFIQAPLYTFKNQLYFKENFNDTLFCVKDSILIPHIIYNEKELLLDKNFELKPTGNVQSLEKELEKVKDKLRTKSIHESERFIFTTYESGLGPQSKENVRILYDKKTGRASFTNNIGCVNDIDGGFDLWPLTIYQDSFMVACKMAFEIKAHVASNAFKNSIPKNPEKKEELKRLAKSLDEYDNPVLMLVKLKN